MARDTAMTFEVIDAHGVTAKNQGSSITKEATVPSDLERLVDRYLDAYSEPDRSKRRADVATIWAAAGELVDPPLQSAGHDAIVAQADALLGQFPAHRFRRHTDIDAHHGFARYGWQLVDATGAVALEGFDFAEVDDGRLRRVVGFFGPMPGPAA